MTDGFVLARWLFLAMTDGFVLAHWLFFAMTVAGC